MNPAGIETVVYARLGRWLLAGVGGLALVALAGTFAMRDMVVGNSTRLEALRDRVAVLEAERNATEAIRDRLGAIDGRLGVIEQRLKMIEGRP